ncbi:MULTISPECIES: hypothetical protein [unclassified Fusibacter]|uniref:hypothetical protein n=1 Tax=unclassified Fusibacter TaxID=2624464 RepID=UPI0010129972|nr:MULTISPECIES: hypothetical protein [unclassified Fusibacter]MCK8060658.1 hypothetical protein [Fusibacter sp. A2]NPE22888.1 hypothetical protein [Fusibacter sp. A1]RXV59956.1 hypothetical protein DWB64_13665 [Fusibacter sp. A1]
MTVKKRKNKQFSIFSILFLVLPILAVIIGFFGTDLILKVMDKPKTELEQGVEVEVVEDQKPQEVTAKPDPEEVVNDSLDNSTSSDSNSNDVLSQSINLPSLTVYGMQFGSFANYDNGEKLMLDLAKKGVPTVVSTQSTYKVLSISSVSKESVKKSIDSRDWDGANYFIASFSFSPVLNSVNADVDKEEITAICDGIKSIYESQGEFALGLSYKESELDKTHEYGEVLMADVAKVRELLDALGDESIEDFSIVAYAILDELTEYATVLQNARTVDLNIVWDQYLAALFGYEKLGK